MDWMWTIRDMWRNVLRRQCWLAPRALMTLLIFYGAVHMDDVETGIVKTWCSVKGLLTAQTSIQIMLFLPLQSPARRHSGWRVVSGNVGPIGSRKRGWLIKVDKRPRFLPRSHHHCSNLSALLLFTHTLRRMSTENTSTDFEKLQEKFGRFRILIIGRANSGKTTILRAICNSTEDPEIYDGEGRKVRPHDYTVGWVDAKPRD